MTMYSRNCWYVICASDELANDRPLACELAGNPVVLYRTSTGEPVAMEDRCSHRLAPLSRGRIEGDHLRCMYHGICFNREGRCVEVPGQAAKPGALKQAVYPTFEQYGWIWLWYGDPGAADLDLLPPTELIDPDIWYVQFGDMTYAADHVLISDNLCDLSHLAYVHENTLGTVGSDQWAINKPRISQLERGVRVDRWLTDSQMPPFLGGIGDAFITYDYLLPGVFALRSKFFTAGVAAACNYGDPADHVPLHTGASLQAVTPLGPGRARYFFSVSAPKAEPGGRVQIVFAVSAAAFAEDKEMIEAQQQMLDRSTDPRLAATSSDEAAVRFRRLLARSAQSA